MKRMGWWFLTGLAGFCFLGNLIIILCGHGVGISWMSMVLSAGWIIVNVREATKVPTPVSVPEEKKAVTEADLPYSLDDPDVLIAIHELNELCDSEFAVPLTVERWREDLKPKLTVHTDSVWVPESMTWDRIRAGTWGSNVGASGGPGGSGNIEQFAPAIGNQDLRRMVEERGFSLISWNRLDNFDYTSFQLRIELLDIATGQRPMFVMRIQTPALGADIPWDSLAVEAFHSLKKKMAEYREANRQHWKVSARDVFGAEPEYYHGVTREQAMNQYSVSRNIPIESIRSEPAESPEQDLLPYVPGLHSFIQHADNSLFFERSLPAIHRSGAVSGSKIPKS